MSGNRKPPTSEAVLAALYAKRPQVIKPGLERIRAGLPYLCAGALATPSVLIAGTNGKGTTTGYLFQMLAASGVPTGIFTSPHLYEFSERIQTSCPPRVTDAELVTVLSAFVARTPPAVYEAMSFFEVSTLLGLDAFQARGTAVNLMEVGLGGRFDSTNAIEPGLSIITSIGLDHQQFLGDTTAKIAFEKAGIMRPGVPVVLPAPGARGSLDADAESVLLGRAAALGAPVFRAGLHATIGGGCLTLAVPGLPPATAALPRRWRDLPPFLADNLEKAAIAYWFLAHAPAFAGIWRALPAPDLTRALDESRLAASPPPPSLRARFERTTARGRDVLLDVCHNVHGAKAFTAALAPVRAAAGGRRLPAVVSILADKDVDGVLDVLRAALDPIHLYALDAERTWSKAQLAARHQDLPWHENLETAWDAALRDEAASGLAPAPIVACGSVYGLGQVLSFLGLDVFAARS